MDIKKVLNDGESVENKKAIHFLTTKGCRTPKEIWIGKDNFGNELREINKKSLLSAIERNNRVLSRSPEILNIQ